MMVSFLVAMLWKSLLIAGGTLALAFLLRRRAAADRLIVLRTGIVAILALPLMMAMLPALQIVAFAAPQVTPLTQPLPQSPDVATIGAGFAAPPEPAVSIDVGTTILFTYLAGLAVLGLRQFAGLALLRRWTARACEVGDPEWRAAFESQRTDAPDGIRIRLLVSEELKSPLSWGWRRPAILIDPATLDRPEDAEAILVHEIAHIIRRDWPALMLGRVAVILFWFNPLVWLLEREMVQQCEEVADLAAAARVGPAHYAERLLGWARFHAPVPANSIAGTESALGRRVRNILNGPGREQRGPSIPTRAAALLCVGVATPVAAMQLVQATPEPSAVPSAPPPAAAPAPSDEAAEPAVAAPPVAPSEPVRPDRPARPERQRHHDQADPDRDFQDFPDPATFMPPIAVTIPPMPWVDVNAEVAKAMRGAQWPKFEQHQWSAKDRAEWEKARRDAQKAWAHGQEARRKEMAAAMRQMQDIPQMVARSMASSAAGMEAGAAGMERGADEMERSGERLRTDRAYRERAIEEARMRGRAVTHEELIAAGKSMAEGARGMRDGARKMRESAARMRSSATY